MARSSECERQAKAFLTERGFSTDAQIATTCSILCYNHPGRPDKAERDVLAYVTARGLKMTSADVHDFVNTIWAMLR